MLDYELFEEIALFQKEISEWEMDLAFAEANTQNSRNVVWTYDGEEL